MSPQATIEYSIKDVEKVIKFDGEVKEVKIARLTAPGENYNSLILRADFEVEKNGNSRTISAVAKCLQQTTGEDMATEDMNNEIRWYSEILPLIKDFANENEIYIDFVPEYYGSRYSLDSSKQEADSNSVLILENLVSKGYQNDDRYIGFDLITSKAILKRLALFHALPILIKQKKPELFEIIRDLLKKNQSGPPGKDGPDGPDGHQEPADRPSAPSGNKGPPPNPGKRLLEAVLKLPEFAAYASKIKPLLDKPIMGPGVFDKLTKEPWNTVTHNDFWVNNVMINHQKDNEPLVKIVDFQMCLYGSFAQDLIFFLLSSVRNDITIEYMDDLLRFYYDEFTSILQQVNLELTYNDYLGELKEAAEIKVLYALAFSTIIFGKKGTDTEPAVEEKQKEEGKKVNKMSQRQIDKVILIASEAIKRNWI